MVYGFRGMRMDRNVVKEPIKLKSNMDYRTEWYD